MACRALVDRSMGYSRFLRDKRRKEWWPHTLAWAPAGVLAGPTAVRHVDPTAGRQAASNFDGKI